MLSDIKVITKIHIVKIFKQKQKYRIRRWEVEKSDVSNEEKNRNTRNWTHTNKKKARHSTKATSTKHFGNRYLPAERNEGIS